MANPAVEYRRLQGDIRTLIERFPVVLNEHVARQEQTPHFWSHVGDLRKARLDLLHTMAFLGDLDSKEMLLAEGELR
jgi:hypothetical protein